MTPTCITLQKVVQKSSFAQAATECHLVKCTGLYAYIRQSTSRPNSKILILYRLQHESPAVLVIAQQYSSVRFISLRFYPARRNSARVENISFFQFLLHFLNMQLPKPGNICRLLCLNCRLCWLGTFLLNALFNDAVKLYNVGDGSMKEYGITL